MTYKLFLNNIHIHILRKSPTSHGQTLNPSSFIYCRNFGALVDLADLPSLGALLDFIFGALDDFASFGPLDDLPALPSFGALDDLPSFGIFDDFNTRLFGALDDLALASFGALDDLALAS